MSKQITKFIVVFCCVLAVAGCEVTDKLDIAKAKAMCEDHGGIYNLDANIYDEINYRDGKAIYVDSRDFRNYSHPSVAKYLKGEGDDQVQ